MRRLALLSLLALSTCTNFDALVERKCAEGGCGVDSSHAPQLGADPLTLDFGMVTSDQQPKKRLQVRNLDGGTAESLTLNFSGAAANDFSVATTQCSTLTAGQSCPVDVQFSPADTTLGVRTAELVVSASLGESLRVPLTAELVPALSAPTTLDFGDVEAGTSLSLDLNVTNHLPRPGSVALTVLAPFFVVMNGCLTVGIGQGCTVKLRFDASSTPSDDVSRALYLDVEQNRATVALTGRSVARNQLSLTPAVFFAPDGGAVEKGATLDVPFHLQNVGTQRIKSIGYSLSAGAPWSVAAAGCSSLEPDAGCDGVLRIAPTVFGYYPVVLSVDAGVIGGAVSSGTARGVGFADIVVNVKSLDAGAFVTSSVDGGSCFDRCTYTVHSDPAAPASVRLLGREHLWFNPVAFTPSRAGCDYGRCDLFVQQETTTVDVTQEMLPFAFVTPVSYPGGLGGIAGADDTCQRVAADAGLPGQFAAYLYRSDAGSGATRFPPDLLYFRSNGAVWGPLGNPDASIDFGVPVWVGSATANCNDWAGGALGTVTNSTGTASTPVSCGSGYYLFCAARTGSVAHAGGWVMAATVTSGLAVNFQAECDAVASVLGLTYVRPYISRAARGACGSFDGDAGFFGSLYRADGARLMLDAGLLQSCTAGNAPAFLSPVGHAWFPDAGVFRLADGRPVRTSGSGQNSIASASGGTDCSDWSSVAPSPTYHRFYGNATKAGTQWWYDNNNYIGCDVASFLYCVGRR